MGRREALRLSSQGVRGVFRAWFLSSVANLRNHLHRPCLQEDKRKEYEAAQAAAVAEQEAAAEAMRAKAAANNGSTSQ